MHKLIAVFFILQFKLISISMYAMDIKFKLYGKGFGLQWHYVFDIEKDKEGFYWLATEKGVYRFDGNNFNEIKPRQKAYRGQSVNHLFLSDHFLYAIYDKKGCVRMNLTDYKTEELDSLPILDLTQDSNGVITTLYKDGRLIQHDGGKPIFIKKFNVPKSTGFVYDWKNRIIISTVKNEIDILDKSTLTVVKKFVLKDYQNRLSFNQRKGELYLNPSYTIFKLDSNERLVQFQSNLSSTRGFINYFQFFNDGTIFFVRNNKPFFLDKNNVEHQITLDGLNNYDIMSAFTVGNNRLLLGTNSGLVDIDLSEKTFGHQKFNGGDSDYGTSVARKIIAMGNDAMLLFGFPYNYSFKEGQEPKKLVDRSGAAYDAVRVGDLVYITTEGGGLRSMRTDGLGYQLASGFPFSSKTSYYSICFNEEDSSLLIGGDNDLIYFHLKNRTGRKINMPFKMGIVKTMVYDAENNTYWVGTEKGLIRLDRNLNVENIAKNDQKDFWDTMVVDLLIDKRINGIWIATEKNLYLKGLNTRKTLRKVISPLFEKSKISSIVKDFQDRLWVGTFDGIIVYDPAADRLYKIDSENILLNNEFNYKSAAVLANGKVVFGGLSGYDIINAENVVFNSDTVYGKISGIEIFGRLDTVFMKSNLHGENQVSINTDEQYLRVNFSNIFMNQFESAKYQYNLNGNNWIPLGSDDYFVNIHQLPEGQHTLYIRGESSFGKYVNFKPLKINANVPFYKKRNFIWSLFILLVIMSGLFIFLLLKLRSREQKLKNEISMDLHDEVGTILTRALLISESNKFSNKISEIQNNIREALYSLRLYIHSLNDSDSNANQFVAEIRSLVENILGPFISKIDFKYRIENDVLISVEKNRELKLSIFEILTNIVKHAGAETVMIDVVLEGRYFMITIEDDGILSDLSLIENKGNGIKNLRKRANRLRGYIMFDLGQHHSGMKTKIKVKL